MLLEALLSMAGSALGSTAYPALAEAAARTCQLALTKIQSTPSSGVAQHHAAMSPAADEELVLIHLHPIRAVSCDERGSLLHEVLYPAVL